MRWRRRLLGRLGYWVLKCIYATIRVRVHGKPQAGPGIFAFWHGQQLCLYGGLPDGDVVAPVSQSLDGELQVGVLSGFGITPIRGSSSKGGASALRGFVRALRGGGTALIAVDGPRGPSKVPKKGAFYLSRRLHVPIYPVIGICSRYLCLERTWDKMRIPLPFSRIDVKFGRPMTLDEDMALDGAFDIFIVAIEQLSSDNDREGS